MRLRNVKNAREIVDNSSFVVHEPKEYKGKFNELFGNNNPIYLEIGMGKGKFIIEHVKRNPNINYVVCRALEKLEDKKLSNVKIICMDAKELDEVFDKEISTIYLNFSDPWPKKRHAKRHKGNLGKGGDDIHRKHMENVNKIMSKRLAEELQSDIPEIVEIVKNTIFSMDMEDMEDNDGNVEKEIKINDKEYKKMYDELKDIYVYVPLRKFYGKIVCGDNI